MNLEICWDLSFFYFASTGNIFFFCHHYDLKMLHRNSNGQCIMSGASLISFILYQVLLLDFLNTLVLICCVLHMALYIHFWVDGSITADPKHSSALLGNVYAGYKAPLRPGLVSKPHSMLSVM